MKKAVELGIQTQLFAFEDTVKPDEILNKIAILNKDDSVNGILVQLPLYQRLSPFKYRILNSVNPIKDADGLSAINFGLFSQDIMNGILPATVDACLEVIKESFNGNFEETNVVIINNSNLIGKPLATILSTLNCTVTIANKFTKQLEQTISNSDIIISATGQGELFDYSIVKENALVIDVTSINKNNKVVGDFKKADESIQKNISYTPVPGGIGPLTIACLFRNLINLAKLQN